MKSTIRTASLLALATVFVAGCNQSTTQPAAEPMASSPAHDHSGWWCAEHGVPEEICSMCSAKVAADFQKKGDWCAEHDRAKSQCFQCDPALKDKFAAQYRAKYGKEPPAIEDEQKTGDHEKS